MPIAVAALVTLIYQKRAHNHLMRSLSDSVSRIIGVIKEFGHDSAPIELKEMLVRISKLLDVEHSFSLYRVIYFITDDHDDEWLRVLKIRPMEKFVLLKEVSFGAIGTGAGLLSSFTDLNVTAQVDTGSVELINPKSLVRGGEEIWEGSILFDPPINPGDDDRIVNLQGTWPNLWRPLRDTGRDSGKFNLSRHCDLLEIVLTFPRGTNQTDVSLDPVGRRPRGDVYTEIDKNGRLQIIWAIENAKPETYQYLVTWKRPGLSEE